MAVFLLDAVLDAGLTLIDDNVDELWICSAIPSTYAEASSTYALGHKKPPTISAAGDAGGGGRKITVTAITDGTTTGTDTATHWALCKLGTTVLYAAGTLTAPVAVTTGIDFTLTEFTITIPDAT